MPENEIGLTSLNVVTLNMGRGKPGLDGMLTFLRNRNWDVACIQDVSRDIVDAHPDIFGQTALFSPMSRHLIDGKPVDVGIGIFSRHLPFRRVVEAAYWNDIRPVKDLEGVTYTPGAGAAPHDLAKVRETESRQIVFAEVLKDGKYIWIANTHGVWVAGGKADDHQRRYMQGCAELFRQHGPSILACDLNAARGGEIFEMFANVAGAHGSQFVDHTRALENTIDWEKRGKGGVQMPKLAVDHIFSLGYFGSVVQDVEAHFGVSDHAAITATVRI